MKNDNLFSKNLKYLREISNLTQEQLATKLNLTRAKLGHLETGRREPNLGDIKNICNFFNVGSDIILVDMKEKEDFSKDKELIKLTKTLSEKDKDVLINVAKGLKEGNNNKDKL